ncbi:MAG: hypothetical protein ABH872_01485 [Candidatus Omnitrophota bacterium]
MVKETLYELKVQRKTVGTKLTTLSQYAARDSKRKFVNIMQHVNKESLKASFYTLDRNKAVGVDNVIRIIVY